MQILRAINNRVPLCLRNCRLLDPVYQILTPFDHHFSDELVVESNKYISSKPGIPLKRLKKDMIREYIRRKAAPNEYFAYRFFEKPIAERNTYFLDWERARYFTKGKWNCIPPDKYSRYLLFRSLYHRDVIRIQFSGDPAEDETYQKFLSEHCWFIAKPSDGFKGKGVVKLRSEDVPDLAKLQEIMEHECVLEEVIEQGDETQKFHPSSVNTLRYVSAISDDGEVKCVFALFRTGRGESIVDNVGSGGIIALVDSETGVVISDGICGIQKFEHHPDTDVVFRGFELPEWEAVCRMAEIGHQSQPMQKLLGWDFAWTKKGWDVVEVNHSPSFASVQALTGVGIRSHLESVLGGFED